MIPATARAPWPAWRRPLPRSVRPMLDETLDSYVRRLAEANLLDAQALRVFLTGSRRADAPVPAAALSTLTGLPERTLAWAMLELREPQELAHARFSSRPHITRSRRAIACRCCSAAADAHGDVERFMRHEQVVCLQHRRWILLPRGPMFRQPDLTAVPAIVRANLQHRRLIRRHGRRMVFEQFQQAERICAVWHEHGVHEEHFARLMDCFHGPRWRVHRNDPTLAAARYPQIVALTRILTSPRWRHALAADNPRLRPGGPFPQDPEYEALVGQVQAILDGHAVWSAQILVPLRELAADRRLQSGAGTTAFVREIRRTVAPHYEWESLPRSRSPEPLAAWVRREILHQRHPQHVPTALDTHGEGEEPSAPRAASREDLHQTLASHPPPPR